MLQIKLAQLNNCFLKTESSEPGCSFSLSRSSMAFWLGYRQPCSLEMCAEPLKALSKKVAIGGGQKGNMWHQGRVTPQEPAGDIFEAMNL